MGMLVGEIRESANGQLMAAQVCVRQANGRFAHPDETILKVGPGDPFFYTEGRFELSATRGKTEILVERGTEYIPQKITVECPERGHAEASVEMERWVDLPQMGWYPGNTHIHYSEKETNPDARLRLDPRIHDLRLTVISILQRNDIPYASNKYPVGLLNEFSSAHHLVDCGEESRHNTEAWEIGYGHIMLIKLKKQVDPMSRGLLVDQGDPDYPPLSYACDETRRQGGLVIWCHNGIGMEAPVAASLGKLDAMNFFDPSWMDPEYDIWYRLLNCGIPLPASTGSDWFICSNNRVYVPTGGEFQYDSWLENLRKGRSFITNGPAIFLQAENRSPGDTMEINPGSRLEARVSWLSHYPLQRIEIVQDGEIVAYESHPEGTVKGKLKRKLKVNGDSWIAARCSSDVRDSYSQPVYAHTSPIYIKAGRPGRLQASTSRGFIAELNRSLEWIRNQGRYEKREHQEEVVDLFEQSKTVYGQLANGRQASPSFFR